MLTEQQDAYGRMIYDHLHGRKTREIVERDDGWIDLSGGAPTYFADFPQWPLHQQRAMACVRGAVLDVGCGAGRCSLYLQNQGHRTVATDQSPLAVQTCRERGVRDARVIPVTQLPKALGVFDTILMMGNNFGLFANRHQAKRILARFHRMTSPQARIIAESNDVYKTDDPDHLAYHERNRKRGRMPGQIRIRIRYRAFRTPWFDYLMVSKGEMEELLIGTGWRVATTLDSPGSVYVAVIEKDAV